MITDEDIAKIYEWADKYGIMNGRRSQESWGGFGYKEWTKGIPRKKEALIKVESLKISEEEIKELPNELFNLPNLKELDMRATCKFNHFQVPDFSLNYNSRLKK